jgi:hypothetical protein
MNSRRKPYLVAASLLLAAIALLLWPPGRQSISPTTPLSSGQAARRPAPSPSVTSVTSPRSTRGLARFVKLADKGELPKLTREQIDVYLQAQRRTAGSLLAIFQLTDDETFLREAIEKFPYDPQVLITSLQLRNDPAERLEILANLKRADPDNSIANCLSARILFDLGNNDGALAELSETFGKTMRDYNLLSQQNVEEAYLSSGYSAVEAKLATMVQATKPLLMQMPNVADGLKKQRAAAAAAGDEEGVRSSREIQLEMARQIQKGNCLLDTLLARNLEKRVLKEIGTPESQARIAELDEQTKSMRDQATKIPILMANTAVPESDWLLYFDRLKMLGEPAANAWLLEKHPDL